MSYTQNEAGIFVKENNILVPEKYRNRNLWVNTNEYRREALHFEKFGCYTTAPAGTRAHKEYWDEQEKRCKEGYSVGGRWITGRHYFYLNFCQIKLTKKRGEEDLVGVVKDKKTAIRKVRFFPDFWDGDADYYTERDIARNNGQHFGVLKARRKGFSFKNGADGVWEYEFERESVTLIGAYDTKYLYPEGTMGMANQYIDFIDKHTDWRKRRLINKVDFKKSGFKETIDGVEVDSGFKSMIMAVSFKDNPDVARGKDGTLIMLEEAGNFPNIKEAFEATKPTVEDGDHTTGQIVFFGTGSKDAEDWGGFSELFKNPQHYNIRCYENEYDEDGIGKKIAYFVPNYVNKPGYIDADGNSLIDEAIYSDYKQREEKKKTAKSPKDYDAYVLEYCHTPDEAMTISGSNMFPTAELLAWKKQLTSTNSKYAHIGTYGEMERSDTGVVKFKINEESRPVDEFPLRSFDKRAGCVTIYYTPYRDITGTTPDNLYFACLDPYGVDSDNGESLAACYIMVRPNKFTSPDNCIVASFVGRRDNVDDVNKEIFDLCEYYNAKLAFENDRGDNIISYAKRFKKLEWLVEEFDILSKSDTKYKSLGRKFGYSMRDKFRKMTGEMYLRDWLITPRGRDESGNYSLNLHKIFDVAVIDELLKYNATGNFDRVSALLGAMFYMHDLYDKEIEETSNVYDEFTKLFN